VDQAIDQLAPLAIVARKAANDPECHPKMPIDYPCDSTVCPECGAKQDTKSDAYAHYVMLHLNQPHPHGKTVFTSILLFFNFICSSLGAAIHPKILKFRKEAEKEWAMVTECKSIDPPSLNPLFHCIWRK